MAPYLLNGERPVANAPPLANAFSTTVPQNINGGWSTSNTICPPGLEYLMGLDHLFVKRTLDFLDGFIGWEERKKYNVLDRKRQPIFYIVEESDTCSRYCLGSYRDCEFQIVDQSGREVLRTFRPCRCVNCCCPCCLQVIQVYSGDSLLGSVEQNWAAWRPTFSVRDSFEQAVLAIRGPWIRFCVDVAYQIRSIDGKHRVGIITKKRNGYGEEFLNDADTFAISFPSDLDVKIKAVLLSACLLIDMMYFEENRKIG